MSLNWAILIPSLISIVFNIFTFILTKKAYKMIRIVELRNIMYSWLLVVPFSLIFLTFEFLKDDQYNLIRTYAGSAAAILGNIANLIILFSILNLSGKSIQVRHYILTISLFIGYGIFSYSINWIFDQGEWNVVYEPQYGLIAFGIPSFWIFCELIFLAYENLSYSKKYHKAAMLILIGWILYLLSSVILIIERNVLTNSSSVYYLDIHAIGIFLVSVGLYIYPLVIVPANINSRLLIINNRTSGSPILEYSFSKKKIDKSIFSGSMSAILRLFKEITKQSDNPTKFEFQELTIMIESSKNFIAFFVADRASKAINYFLKSLLDNMEADLTNKIINQDNLIENIKDKFYFVNVEDKDLVE